MKVLHIDDDPDYAEVFKHMLEDTRLRHELRQVQSGAEALAYLDSAGAEKPGLIVLDIMIPGEDSFETLRKIKEHPLTKDTPVLILSNAEEKEIRQKSYKGGGVAFIPKKWDAHILNGALTQLKLAGRI